MASFISRYSRIVSALSVTAVAAGGLTFAPSPAFAVASALDTETQAPFHAIADAPVFLKDAVISGQPGSDKSTTTTFAEPASALMAQKDYDGSMKLTPDSMTSSDYGTNGVLLAARDLPPGESAVVTDRAPGGNTRTYDFPVVVSTEGTVDTTLLLIGPPPEIGDHLIEITTTSGVQAGATLEVLPDPAGSAVSTATPSKLTADEAHDRPVRISVSGLMPDEWITAHIRTPDGFMSQLGGNLKANADGTFTYDVQLASAAATPGEWSVAIYGMDTGKQTWTSWFVDKSPDDREVGKIEVPNGRLTAEQFGDPGLSWAATGLPPFGLFDLVLRPANGFDIPIGRYRADGTGHLSNGVYGNSPELGIYTLSLINVNTADWSRTTFAVTDTAGNVPPPPTIALNPQRSIPAKIVQDGFTVTATGYQPNTVLWMTVLDEYRRPMTQQSGTRLIGQSDSNGNAQFRFTAEQAPATGNWEVAVASPSVGGLIQRATLEVADDESGPGSTPPPPSSPTPGTGSADPGEIPQPGEPEAPPTEYPVTLPPALAGSGSRAYFVRLDGSSGLEAKHANARARGAGGAIGAAERRTQQIQADADAVIEAAEELDIDSAGLYKTTWTVPGVALQMSTDAAHKLAERGNVISVTPIIPKTLVQPVANNDDSPHNGVSDILTGAQAAWTGAGEYTGKGQTIAVIDTGVDYTHATFGGIGGDGTAWSESGRDFPTAMPPAEGRWDPSIIAPGWDFAGERYDSASFPIPRPDANPIDGPGGGHGTHVAATAAGRGVNADGSTYTGDYRQLSPEELATMRVAPGSAPQATIIPLKIFGDFGGSTSLTGAALDWIAGQVATGHHIDVFNASLGSAYSAVDDPENAMVNALLDEGVLPVISAGNDGDVTDVAGSPGNAPGALAVAASANGFSVKDAMSVTAPVKKDVIGQYSVEYNEGDWEVSADIARPANIAHASGCSAFDDGERAQLAGKIVWLEWQEGTECRSSVRFDNAAAANALGVILTSTENDFEVQIAGNTLIPGIQLTKDATNEIAGYLAQGAVSVRLSDDLVGVLPALNPALSDTLGSFSSRGVHGTIDDVIKPDLASPGVNMMSAAMGSGTAAKPMTGTSMASPHAAGIAALARQAHPNWAAERVKALLMNTAIHDVSTPEGIVVSPLRQGTGRIDARGATESDVTARSVQNGMLVSASFGVVEVPAEGAEEIRTVELTNTGDEDRTFDVDLSARTSTPGAILTVSPAQVTVPASGTASVTVTLSVADATALRRTVDPGFEGSQSTANHPSDISASINFTSLDASQPSLRVTAYAAPRPVSNMVADRARFDGPTALQTMLSHTGVGVDQGSDAQAYVSRPQTFVLGARSDELTFNSGARDTLRGSDIRAAGASSDAPNRGAREDGIAKFAIALNGPIVSLGTLSYPMVQMDLDRDGRADFLTTATQVPTDGGTRVRTYDLGTGLQVDAQDLNGLTMSPAQWDNDTSVLPVSLKSLGYTASTSGAMRYRAVTESLYASNGRQVDSTEWIDFDVYTPEAWTSSAGAGVTLNRDIDHTQGQLLTIVPENRTGLRAVISDWIVTGSGVEQTPPPQLESGAEDGAAGSSPRDAQGGHLAQTGSPVHPVLAMVGILAMLLGIALMRRRRLKAAPRSSAG